MITLVHISDLHFGRDADLAQIAALEAFVAERSPTAVVISGDLTQRSRHGEYQRALVFVDALSRVAPTMAIPGNHDVEWWTSPFGILGARAPHWKYRHYFGPALSPTLALPCVLVTSVLTSHGVAAGSMTWKFWRDTAVKGHLPEAEVEQARRTFAAAPDGIVRVVALHHNVLRGAISRRMGLARWRAAQEALGGLGADLILCGHDHQEGAGLLDGGTVVSTAGTHTSRTRGARPSAFNVVEVTEREIVVGHWCWDRTQRCFAAGPVSRFPRRGR